MWKKPAWGLALAGLCVVLIVSVLHATDGPATPASPAAQLTQAPASPAAPARRPVGVRRDLPIVPGEGNQRTRLQLELFHLICENARVLQIDVERLSASSPEALAADLAKLGDLRLVTRLDDQLDLRGELSVKLGDRVPNVKQAAVSGKGAVVPSVSYDNIGTVVELRGAWWEDDGDWADLFLNLDASLIGRGPSISAEVEELSLPTFGEFRLQKLLRVRSGQPMLMLASQPAFAGDAARTGVLFVRLAVTRLDG